MNLTQLFNFSFLKENIKKSKAVILICILLVPIINVISCLMSASSSERYIPTIIDISAFSLIGLYIIPILLSITLFSFAYKRKSSDFVMSFPVSKKQIFLSNTLGGIIVILLMNIVNYLFMLITIPLTKNILINYQMVFDTFLLWTVSYIFVFTCSNIAASVSSNKITTVIVTMLVLFFVPFVHTFITSPEIRSSGSTIYYTYCEDSACIPSDYKCYSKVCEENRAKNLYTYPDYTVVNDYKYTLPYDLIYGYVFGFSTASSSVSTSVSKTLFKMAFLSIIYIIIGLLLFQRRKFETVETSFKSEKVHILVRSLTTVPILCLYYIIVRTEGVSIFTCLFLFVLIVAYVIIYDLITRKKVINILKSLAALIITAMIVILVGESSRITQIDIRTNDIEKLTFTEGIINETIKSAGYTTSKDIINYIMSIHINNILPKESVEDTTVQISAKGKVYEFSILISEEEVNHIVGMLKENNNYHQTSKDFEAKDAYAISLASGMTYVDKDSKLYDELIKYYQNVDLNSNLKKEDNYIFKVGIHTYDNYTSNMLEFSVTDETVKQEILDYYNERTKEAIERGGIITYSSVNGFDNNYYSDVNQDEIKKFILDNIDEKVDIQKDYMYIRFYADLSSIGSFGKNYWSNGYIFATNKVEELKKIAPVENSNADYPIAVTYEGEKDETVTS